MKCEEVWWKFQPLEFSNGNIYVSSSDLSVWQAAASAMQFDILLILTKPVPTLDKFILRVLLIDMYHKKTKMSLHIQHILIPDILMVFLDHGRCLWNRFELTALAAIDLMCLAMKTITFPTHQECKVSRYSHVVSLHQKQLEIFRLICFVRNLLPKWRYLIYRLRIWFWFWHVLA